MRHMISLIDGTGVTATYRRIEDRYSNPYMLNTLISSKSADGCDQIAFYTSGLGSNKTSSPMLQNAFAYGIDTLVRDAYVNICSNFRVDEQGIRDKLYLFGFSRGAIVARALAGIISSQGLLYPWRIDNYDRIWSNFINGKRADRALSKYIMKDVQIEFLGLFDCVFGNRNEKTSWKSLSFPNKNLSSGVKNALHLLAMDESRSFFFPMLFDDVENEGQVLHQVWMPGVHTDVGGGYFLDFLSRVALLTMIREVERCTDIRFVQRKINEIVNDLGKCNDISVNNELERFWKLAPRRSRIVYNTSNIASHFIHPIASLIGETLKFYRNRPAARYDVKSQFMSLPTFRPEEEEFWEYIVAGES